MPKIPNAIVQASILSLAVLLAACAVQYAPADLRAAPSGISGQRSLAVPLSVQLRTGYTRELRTGSQWRPVGAIAEGTVYRPVNDVLTLEGAHIHEAYLVVRDDSLVGFYLPAERGFSPLTPSLPLQFK